MPADYHRILLLFVDGLGLAAEGDHNPLSTESTPALEELLGGPLTVERVQRREDLVLAAVDASLGVPGLPQSATGQTALFTGVNGARQLGHHVVGLPGRTLRQLIREHSLFRRLSSAGVPATFANAYSPDYLERLEAGRARPSVTTCAVTAADLPLRRLADLERGRAVAWDIEGDLFARQARLDGPRPVAARVAGQRLADLAASYRLTVFETFLTDLAGHLRPAVSPAEALRRLDDLLAGVFARRDGDLTVVLTSDHGNLEDLSRRTHTANPVPLLAIGPAAGELGSVRSILEVAPRITELLTGAASSS